MAAQKTSKKQKREAEAQAAFERGWAALSGGNPQAASEFFMQASRMRPKWADPREGLAIAFLRGNKPAEALSVLFSCLSIRPIPPSSIRLLCTALRRYPVRALQGANASDVAAALALPGIDLGPLVRLVLRQLAVGGALHAALETGRSEGWRAAARAYLDTDGKDKQRAGEEKLLVRALESGLNTDAEIELLLTAMRRAILTDTDPGEIDTPRMLALVTALARQCRRNEHVWFVDADEAAALDALSLDEAALMAGDRAQGVTLLLCSLYAPVERALDPETDPNSLRTVRPREVAAFAAAAIAERRAEAEAAAAIPTVGSLANAGAVDAVSRAVAAQYEDNPYPRWIEINPTAAGALRRAVTNMLPDRTWPFPGEAESVLIAGCGTGHEVVTTYAGFAGTAKVTAIDLSRASLGYAALKSAEHGGGVEFFHMDILDLPKLGRSFDVIRSAGVLHHMADPLAGWGMLVRHLNPGGLMNVALYSAAAREPLDALGAPPIEELADAAGEIRAFRRGLIVTADGEDAERVRRLPEDFWSLSGCRDLLFHARENRFTLAEIQTALDGLGLEFLGFYLSPEAAAGIEASEPGLTQSRDLKAWRYHEAAHPDTFGEMYNFWCRKPAA